MFISCVSLFCDNSVLVPLCQSYVGFSAPILCFCSWFCASPMFVCSVLRSCFAPICFIFLVTSPMSVCSLQLLCVSLLCTSPILVCSVPRVLCKSHVNMLRATPVLVCLCQPYISLPCASLMLVCLSPTFCASPKLVYSVQLLC
jgi:hypothetical protein